ncbi:MAG: uroporphyrinogen decarboxylase family protein, partial [Anaerolineales bacterium]
AAAPEALELHLPSDFMERGRLPVVLEAIRLLKARVGGEIVVGAWVPGPFTLAMHLTEMSAMLTSVVDSPDAVGRVLDALAEVVAEVARAYREAGADFLTVHEMGGSPGYLGPGSFKKLVLPRLKRLMSAIRPSGAPRVLSVCGNTNRALPLLAEAGADALSVDQLNDLARSRAALGPGALLFGNIDPIGTLANGAEADVRQAVTKAIEAGVDAIWPGCDLWPPVPAANMRALVEAARAVARQGPSG